MIRRVRQAALTGLLGSALLYLYTLGPQMLPVHGRLAWPGTEGGLSGLDMDDSGAFVAISDGGTLYQGQLLRDAAGRITSASLGPPYPLLDPLGAPQIDEATDAEDVSLWGDHLLVSYEHPNRVWVHDYRGAIGQPIPMPPKFEGLIANFGYEAVTVLPNGHILVLAEDMTGRAPAWVFDGTAWQTRAPLPIRPLYAATAADLGPDGHLYVLERAFLGIGFAARVLRFETPDAAPQTVLTLPLWRGGNAEGLAVTRAGPNLRLTIITDNNNLPLLQRSEFIEVLLPARVDRNVNFE